MLKFVSKAAGRNIVIVGGVAGGASTAARLRRLDASLNITILEKGPFAAFANCGLPYFIGGVIPRDQNLLLVSPTMFQHKYNIYLNTNCEVDLINRKEKKVRYVNLKYGSYHEVPYDYLVLAPGAIPTIPKIEGVDLPGVFKLSNIPDARSIRSLIWNEKIKRATVVGSGYIGLEMVENLKKRGLEINLIEQASQIMPPLDPEMSTLLKYVLINNNIRLHLNDGLKKIVKENNTLQLYTSNGKIIPSDIIVMGTGVRPNNDLAAKCGLRIGVTKGILVNDELQTSDPCIYACGDAIEVTNYITKLPSHIPLAGPANRQARIIAESICGYPRKFRGVQGTSICGIFDHVIATTGLNEKQLNKLRIQYNKIYIHNGHHVEYYPGSKPIHLKLIYDDNGKILGAQAVGTHGVERRIDVISTMIQMNGTVEDLMETELCYSPPFGSAKDPVNILGMIATNHLNGLFKLADWAKLKDNFILDVRNPNEKYEGEIPGSLNIPQCDVPKNLHLLPKDKPIYVLCREGQRAYNICRLLSMNGFDTYLLSGGIHTYRLINDEPLLKGGAGNRPEGYGCCPNASKFS